MIRISACLLAASVFVAGSATTAAAPTDMLTDFVRVCTPSVALNWSVVVPCVVGVPVILAVQVLSPLSVVLPSVRPGGRVKPVSTLIVMAPLAFCCRDTLTLPL